MSKPDHDSQLRPGIELSVIEGTADPAHLLGDSLLFGSESGFFFVVVVGVSVDGLLSRLTLMRESSRSVM